MFSVVVVCPVLGFPGFCRDPDFSGPSPARSPACFLDSKIVLLFSPSFNVFWKDYQTFWNLFYQWIWGRFRKLTDAWPAALTSRRPHLRSPGERRPLQADPLLGSQYRLICPRNATVSFLDFLFLFEQISWRLSILTNPFFPFKSPTFSFGFSLHF